MMSLGELGRDVEKVLSEEALWFATTVPYADHLVNPEQELNIEYYVRHRVETIKRIHVTARTDALALAKMIDEDYDAAREWARYTVDEMNHDRLFARDLMQHGFDEATVAAIAPLPATRALDRFLTSKIEEIGSLAAVAYSLFVEWNSQRASPRVVEKVGKALSSQHVAGAKAHIGIDEKLDHYEMILGIAHRLVQKHNNEAVLLELLRDISRLLCSYFRELYERTVATRAPMSALSTGANERSVS